MEESDKKAPEQEKGERGKHNRIGFYNSDEEATHDERRGTQGEGERERPPENA